MAVRTVKKGSLEYLAADNIAATHCFTTRRGGISEDYLASLNLGAGRGDPLENVEKNYQILADALGFDASNLVLTYQVHSDVVRQVSRADARGVDHQVYPQCDALITNDPGTALVVFAADCTPVLLYDPVTGAVGAAHAGWRGTANKIAAKTAQAMVRAYGCGPKNICAAIGPNIAQCCFETDADVPEAMRNAYGAQAEAFIRKANHKYYVNLKDLNALALRQAGVENIEISDLCTVCEPDRFWSHRVTKGHRGSQGAIIVCKGASL
jgi:YfiH family protein